MLKLNQKAAALFVALSILASVFIGPSRAEAGVLSWCAAYLDRKQPARPPVALVQFGGQAIIVPIGFEPEAFLEWLKAVYESELPFRALVLFGSRTHFSYGYLPEADSDLDVFVFFDPGAARGDLVKLGKHSSLLPCRVSLMSPNLDFNEGILDREFQFPASIREERAIFAYAERRPFYLPAFVTGDPRSRYRDRLYALNPLISQAEREQLESGRFSLFMPPPRILSINKEAVILLRSGPDTLSQKAILEDSGFQHVFVLP